MGVSSAGLCMKSAHKRYPSYPSHSTKQTNRNIRSKSTMRSLHLLGFLVLLAVLSSSMAHHKPDHPATLPPIPDERRHRRSPQRMKCPSTSRCCRKGRMMGRWDICGGEFCTCWPCHAILRLYFWLNLFLIICNIWVINVPHVSINV